MDKHTREVIDSHYRAITKKLALGILLKPVYLFSMKKVKDGTVKIRFNKLRAIKSNE